MSDTINMKPNLGVLVRTGHPDSSAYIPKSFSNADSLRKLREIDTIGSKNLNVQTGRGMPSEHRENVMANI